MTWETRLFDLFEDLEQQAEGMSLATRDAEVAELARAEYAEVDLAARLHASIDRPLELRVQGAGTLRGRLARAGAGWCLLAPPEAAGQEWVVSVAAVTGIRGLSDRAEPERVRGVVTRLGLGSLLRRVAEDQEPLLLVRVDGDRRRGYVGRVGADFLELRTEEHGVEVLPFRAVAVLRRD